MEHRSLNTAHPQNFPERTNPVGRYGNPQNLHQVTDFLHHAFEGSTQPKHRCAPASGQNHKKNAA